MEEILIDERNGLFCLNTKNTCYIFGKTEKGRLFHCHYGLQVDSARYCKRYDKNVYSFCPYPSDEDEFFSYESAPNEYSVFGSRQLFPRSLFRLAQRTGGFTAICALSDIPWTNFRSRRNLCRGRAINLAA